MSLQTTVMRVGLSFIYGLRYGLSSVCVSTYFGAVLLPNETAVVYCPSPHLYHFPSFHLHRKELITTLGDKQGEKECGHD